MATPNEDYEATINNATNWTTYVNGTVTNCTSTNIPWEENAEENADVPVPTPELSPGVAEALKTLKEIQPL